MVTPIIFEKEKMFNNLADTAHPKTHFCKAFDIFVSPRVLKIELSFFLQSIDIQK